MDALRYYSLLPIMLCTFEHGHITSSNTTRSTKTVFKKTGKESEPAELSRVKRERERERERERKRGEGREEERERERKKERKKNKKNKGKQRGKIEKGSTTINNNNNKRCLKTSLKN